MQRKQHWQVGGALLLGWLTLAGCGSHEAISAYKTEASGTAEVPKAAPMSARPRLAQDAAAAGEIEGKFSAGKTDTDGTIKLVSLTEAQPDRYLIKNATVRIEALDARKVAEQMIAFARGAHGYVSDSHETVDGLGTRSITLQVRVPASQFDVSMQQMETLGKILDKQVNTEDVTEEFVDSSARLRNLKSAELRLLDHLTKTGKLSDTLLIEKELTRVRQEVEQIEGRLKFLAHRVAYSTFNMTIQETPRPQTIVPPQTFSSGKVASDAARSVVEFGQSLWSAVIWLGIWGIFWLPIALLARVLLRRRAVWHTRQGGENHS